MLLIDEEYVGQTIAAVDTLDGETYQLFVWCPFAKVLTLLVGDFGAALVWRDIDTIDRAMAISQEYITKQRARHAEEMEEG